LHNTVNKPENFGLMVEVAQVVSLSETFFNQSGKFGRSYSFYQSGNDI
jgi:hypothetical protein